MICPRCHQTVRDEARFCDSCGFSLGSLAASNQSPSELADTLKPQDPLIGHVIDSKYQLIERLGHGGMGVVYRAERVLVGDEVALKILHSEFVAEEETVERFRREARAAAKLRHPNVVTIYDYGEARGAEAPAYIVMELLNGESLRDILKREGRLPPERAVSLMRGICAGIGLAHRRQIVHRDIKPDNVIVLPPDEEEGRERETVKVVDFGIAKLRDPASGGTLTRKGFQPGTVYYMSPEQCRGDQLDMRSDVYSLGTLLYEMLEGAPPFIAETRTGIIAKHLFDPPPPFSKELSIPAPLESVVMQALAKDPDARPSDASALASELQEAEQEEREARERRAEEERQRAEAEQRRIEEARQREEEARRQAEEERRRREIEEQRRAEEQHKPVSLIPSAPTKAPTSRSARKVLIPLGLLVAVALAVWLSLRLFGSGSSTRTAQNPANSSTPSPSPASTPNAVARSYKPVGDPLRTTSDRFKVALSPDGETLVSTSPLSSSATGPVTNSFDLSGRSIAYSPDGRLLAVGEEDGLIILKDSSDLSLKYEWRNHKDYVFIVAFSNDSRKLVSASADKTVSVWNTQTGRQERQMEIGANDLIVTVDPDRLTVALFNFETRGVSLASIIDGSSAKRTLKGHNSEVSCGAFSPDGQTLALGNSDGKVQLWRVSDGTIIRHYQGPLSGEVGSVLFSPNGQSLAIGWADGDIELLRTSDGASLQTLKNHSRVVRTLAFSRDKLTLASGAEDKTIRLWQY